MCPNDTTSALTYQRMAVHGWPYKFLYTPILGLIPVSHPSKSENTAQKTRRIILAAENVSRWEIIASPEAILWAPGQ
jgi:hypothetical protein